MADFGMEDLEYWNERIEKLARDCGLDYYESGI